MATQALPAPSEDEKDPEGGTGALGDGSGSKGDTNPGSSKLGSIITTMRTKHKTVNEGREVTGESYQTPYTIETIIYDKSRFIYISSFQYNHYKITKTQKYVKIMTGNSDSQTKCKRKHNKRHGCYHRGAEKWNDW